MTHDLVANEFWAGKLCTSDSELNIRVTVICHS